MPSAHIARLQFRLHVGGAYRFLFTRVAFLLRTTALLDSMLTRITPVQASSRSTSSLSERIAAMFQTKAKLRARSKLSLAITTGSANSSPSTDSTCTWSPVTPTHGFTFPASSTAALVYTQPEQNYSTVFEEDASQIGRVLTPEADPFAKADVAISRFSTDVTPTRPVSPGVKYGSRRGSRQSNLRTRKARSAQQGWDFKDSSTQMMEEADDIPVVYSRARGSRSRSRLPTFVDESSPRSPIYELPSSCSIYPAGGPDAPLSPFLVGPAARTRANLVSRFSMSTDSLPSSHSSFAGSADGRALNDVDVDTTFVFGSPGVKDPIVRDFAQRSPKLKRTTMDISGSPRAVKPIVRSSTRASLPSSSPSTHARYAQCMAPALATTKRQASVRTSASEPPLRVQRPSSPFPLVQGLSDGSPKGLGIDLSHDSPAGGDPVNDSGMFCDVAVKDETIYDDAFEDSFVLPEEEMGHLRMSVTLSQDIRRLAEEVCFLSLHAFP